MRSLLFCRAAALDTFQIPYLLYNQLVEQNQSMFELEYLLAFGLGAGLVALTPVVAAAAGNSILKVPLLAVLSPPNAITQTASVVPEPPSVVVL